MLSELEGAACLGHRYRPSHGPQVTENITLRGRLCDMVRPVPAAFAFLVILSPAAVGQDVPSPGDRFALYNHCAPMGLVIESLPDDAAATGLTAVQLKALAESRLRAIGLHESDALTFLHVAASRYAVQLRYMKPVIDVASSETETIRTFSRSAEACCPRKDGAPPSRRSGREGRSGGHRAAPDHVGQPGNRAARCAGRRAGSRS